jgi:tellurite resistance protein
MNGKQVAALVMAKMALSDGQITEEERGFLEPVLPQGTSVDDVLTQAKGHTLKELIGQVENYADRFFIAMRAAAMAHIDMDFDSREEAALNRLLSAVDLNPGDTELLEKTLEDMEQAQPSAPSPRLAELFEQSSFAAQ